MGYVRFSRQNDPTTKRMKHIEIIKTDLKFKELYNREYTDKIILHHTVGIYYGENPADGIHEMHLERGWTGIGYHFVVSKDGKIYEGRPLNTVGAHCENFNDHSVGVAAIGNYMVGVMPQEQKESIALVCRYIKGIYHIKMIYTHRYLGNTECPGDNYPFEDIINMSR